METSVLWRKESSGKSVLDTKVEIQVGGTESFGHPA